MSEIQSLSELVMALRNLINAQRVNLAIAENALRTAETRLRKEKDDATNTKT